MQGNESIAPLNLANISSSTNYYDNDSIVTREAIADTEISIKLDSPAQASSVAYIKACNQHASVTINMQEALRMLYIEQEHQTRQKAAIAAGADEASEPILMLIISFPFLLYYSYIIMLTDLYVFFFKLFFK
ncbi:hypothetical protein O181_096656 [Austropuccinia psidii MF-1]|uniref:Uncharacterized protein n=1 Tax=Austropuccinia psidii MF-1 TaxID=1389203 RepID=A0A9Q3PEE1_9BASI|nr:hypothetical protein [Austropuccinia psidii MF-1]